MTVEDAGSLGTTLPRLEYDTVREGGRVMAQLRSSAAEDAWIRSTVVRPVEP